MRINQSRSRRLLQLAAGQFLLKESRFMFMILFYRSRRKSTLFFLLFSFWFFRLHATELVKTNGEILSGTVVSLNKDGTVVFKLRSGRVIRLQRSEIEQFDSRESIEKSGTVSKTLVFKHSPFYWYTDQTFGMLVLPDVIRYRLDNLETGTQFSDLSLDIVDIYFRLGSSGSLFGFVGNVSEASFENTHLKQPTTVDQAMGAFSFLHFFGGHIGHGFFLRTDAGDVWTGLSDEPSVFVAQANSFQAWIGLGYALPLGRRCSLMMMARFELSEYEVSPLMRGGIQGLSMGILF